MFKKYRQRRKKNIQNDNKHDGKVLIKNIVFDELHHNYGYYVPN